MSNDPKKLLEEIEAFLVRTGMNATEFGLQSKRDRALVFRLREGKDVRSGTASELRRFMETYRRPLAPSSKPRSAAHA
jgi:hypothetical protein